MKIIAKLDVPYSTFPDISTNMSFLNEIFSKNFSNREIIRGNIRDLRELFTFSRKGNFGVSSTP
jgi:hypothetical protein